MNRVGRRIVILRFALTFVVSVVLLCAPSVVARPAPSGVRSAQQAISPGYTTLDRKGCPIFHDPPGPPVPELSAGRGEHCVPLPTSLITIVTRPPGGGCVQNEYVQIRLPRGVSDYATVWYSSIGLGTRWWYPPATFGPASVVGDGAKYQVPVGFGAWSAAGGASAAGDCPGTVSGTYGVAGWGVTGKYLVKGTVTVKGGGGPAPKIHMRASCPSGGSTLTDPNGNYAFLLSPGPCTIAPRLAPPDVATPPQRAIVVPHHTVNHVDFQVPCTAIGGAQDVVAGAARRRAKGSPCKLDVYVKIMPPTEHAGLAFDPGTHAPAFFNSHGVTGSCLSGCVDLLVTVKDDLTHQPPPLGSVRLTAFVTAIANPRASHIAPYPAGLDAGTGHLCYVQTTSDVTCGASSGASVVTPLLDANGQATLRYWAPGLYSTTSQLNPSQVRLRVKAVENCATACPLHQKTGRRVTTFSVYPRRLYYGKFDAPAYWINAFSQIARQQLVTSAGWTIVAGAAPPGTLSTAEDFTVQHVLEKDFQPAFPATAGLGGPSWSVIDPKNWATVVPQIYTAAFSNFDDGLLGPPGVTDFYSSFSLMDQLGRTLFNEGEGDTGQKLVLSVFEVSVCDTGLVCGPGYQAAPVTQKNPAPQLRTPGIHPFLYFYLEAKNAHGKQTFAGGFLIPYQGQEYLPAYCAHSKTGICAG